MDKQVVNMDICESLLALYVPEQSLLKRRYLSTVENGVCYRANVNPERETVVFRVDGNIVTDNNKCDRLVLSKCQNLEKSWFGHFVELKGVDVGHAIEQLEQSVKHQAFADKTLVRKFARIVGRSFPSNAGNPEFEKARERFRKLYKCELKRLKSNQPDTI